MTMQVNGPDGKEPIKKTDNPPKSAETVKPPLVFPATTYGYITPGEDLYNQYVNRSPEEQQKLNARAKAEKEERELEKTRKWLAENRHTIGTKPIVIGKKGILPAVTNGLTLGLCSCTKIEGRPRKILVDVTAQVKLTIDAPAAPDPDPGTTINDEPADILSVIFGTNNFDLSGTTKFIALINNYRNEYTGLYFDTVENPNDPNELINKKITGQTWSYEYYGQEDTYEQIGSDINATMEVVELSSAYPGSNPNKKGVTMPSRVLPIQPGIITSDNMVLVPSNNSDDRAMFVFDYQGKGGKTKQIDPVDPNTLRANGFVVVTEKAEPSDLAASGCNVYLQRSNTVDDVMFIFIKGTDGQFYRNSAKYVVENWP